MNGYVGVVPHYNMWFWPWLWYLLLGSQKTMVERDSLCCDLIGCLLELLGLGYSLGSTSDPNQPTN